MKFSYKWLKSYVPDVPAPEKLADVITMHLFEVEEVEQKADGDTVFEIKILPNRGHDLLSHQGLAREIAGQLAIEFKDPTPLYKIPESKPTALHVRIETDACKRYMGRIIHNVTIGESPAWMKEHLEAIGQRSINNIVDATNIVMFDCGQPTHAFDLRKIKDKTIVINTATEDEELKLVGREGIIVKLKNTDTVITSGGINLALGGIKGGADSGVQADTTDVVIEVGNFDPISTRKTARRLGVLSDAAKRFENGVSPELTSYGMLALSALILELCPDAEFEDVVDIYPKKQEERTIVFSGLMVANKLGITISDQEITNILINYGFSFDQEGDDFKIFVPPLRLDLVIPEDMVEEIGRIYGYDKIKPVLPEINFTPKINETYEKIVQVRNYLVAEGYREVMTYAFTDKGEVQVLASASDKKFLRTNLSDGLKKAYELNKLNLPLLGDTEVKIFEIGTVFLKDGEEIHVAYMDKKGVKEMKLEEFNSPLEEYPRNEGEVEYLNASTPALRATPQEGNKFKMWSLCPFIARDIAVWVPEGVPPEKLKELYVDFGTELLVREPQFFDSFTKDGKTSYAYRLVFQSYDKTLTDEEVNTIMTNITSKIESFGWKVR